MVVRSATKMLRKQLIQRTMGINMERGRYRVGKMGMIDSVRGGISMISDSGDSVSGGEPVVRDDMVRVIQWFEMMW